MGLYLEIGSFSEIMCKWTEMIIFDLHMGFKSTTCEVGFTSVVTSPIYLKLS